MNSILAWLDQALSSMVVEPSFLPSEEVQEGEVVIGVLDDKHLQNLFLLVEKLREEAQQLREQSESQIFGQEPDWDLQAKMMKLDDRVRMVEAISWASLRAELPLSELFKIYREPVLDVHIRAGWKVVVVVPEASLVGVALVQMLERVCVL